MSLLCQRRKHKGIYYKTNYFWIYTPNNQGRKQNLDIVTKTLRSCISLANVAEYVYTCINFSMYRLTDIYTTGYSKYLKVYKL